MSSAQATGHHIAYRGANKMFCGIPYAKIRGEVGEVGCRFSGWCLRSYSVEPFNALSNSHEADMQSTCTLQ